MALSSRSNALRGCSSSSRSRPQLQSRPRCVVALSSATPERANNAAGVAAIAAGLASAVVMFGQPAFADLNEFE